MCTYLFGYRRNCNEGRQNASYTATRAIEQNNGGLKFLERAEGIVKFAATNRTGFGSNDDIFIGIKMLLLQCVLQTLVKFSLAQCCMNLLVKKQNISCKLHPAKSCAARAVSKMQSISCIPQTM